MFKIGQKIVVVKPLFPDMQNGEMYEVTSVGDVYVRAKRCENKDGEVLSLSMPKEVAKHVFEEFKEEKEKRDSECITAKDLRNRLNKVKELVAAVEKDAELLYEIADVLAGTSELMRKTIEGGDELG